MTKINIVLFISLLLVVSGTLTGQEREKILSFPNAAELGSFGRTPVGLFTGTNQVIIPLAELKTRNLTYPISLNYSSNGLMVDKVSSRVGFDWTMAAEGVIIRVINGQPDDMSQFFPYPVNLDPIYFPSRTQQEREAEYSFYNAWHPYQNNEPDLYSFNFCGYTGQFYYDFKSNGKFVLVPYQNLIVTNLGTGFQITDDKGIKYTFVEGEQLQFSPSGAGLTTSTYYLSTILHPQGDLITLHYETVSGEQSYITNVTDDVSRAIYEGTDPPCLDSPTEFYPGTNNPVGNINKLLGIYKLLESIEAPGYGTIVFNYNNNDRLDNGEPRLDNLSVYDMNGGLLRSVKLYQQFPIATRFSNVGNYKPDASGRDNVNYRMFLDRIVISDKLGTEVQKYSFEYNNITELPVRLSYAKDHWGYFNGANNLSLMPNAMPATIQQEYFPGQSSRMSANRNANYLYSKKGLLSKVTFPTGGYTTYEYEPHISVSANHPGLEHGGVRLKKQLHYSSTGQLEFVNEYAYSGGKGGWDYHDIQYYQSRVIHKYVNCHPQQGAYASSIQFETYKLYSSPLYSLSLSAGNNIGYQYVTIYNGDETTNSGKEVDEFEIGYDDFEQMLLYNDRTEGPLMFPRPYTNSGWKSGTKLRETSYKNVSGSYVPVKEAIYTYHEDASNGVINYYPSIQNDDFEWPAGFIIDKDDEINDHFDLDRYSIISIWRYLSKKTENTYDSDGSLMITDTTSYYYDNPIHAQLTREEKNDSKGYLIKKITRYPDDYTTTLYNLGALRTNHIVNLPVDSRQYVNTRLAEGEQLKYSATGQVTDVYKAETYANDIEFSRTNSNPYTFKHKATYTYDLFANLRQIDHDYNYSTTYLWSYGNTLPIAKIENANFAQISSLLGPTFINNLGSTTSSSSLNTQLTQLRSNLKTGLPNTWVSTFTHLPQVGVASQTDPNGVTTKYEYDDFGRLKMIRDDDGHILKTYEYHYNQ
jgi:YD repeat-containing protein